MDDDWRPPTEAEMKVIEARRERSDKISSLMGGYLLKGYKMLGETCETCSTILLESRQGVKYCVACHEVDIQETAKDNPVMSDQAARRLCQEHPVTPATAHTDSALSGRSHLVLNTANGSAVQQLGQCHVEQESRHNEPRVAAGESVTLSATVLPSQTEPCARASFTDSRLTSGGYAAENAIPSDTALRAAAVRPTVKPIPAGGALSGSFTETPLERVVLSFLAAKISWASVELDSEISNICRCSQLACLIRECAEASRAVLDATAALTVAQQSSRDQP